MATLPIPGLLAEFEILGLQAMDFGAQLSHFRARVLHWGDQLREEMTGKTDLCQFADHDQLGLAEIAPEGKGLVLFHLEQKTQKARDGQRFTCRWPQVFHTQGIRLCPMTLFNPVFNCLTPIVIKRSKTQADEGLTPADEAGSVVLRQSPASKLANLFRIDVRDHALGLVTQQLGCRAREHPPGGSLLKQHPGRDSLAMKRRSCGWSEDFMLEVPTGATI